MTQVDRNALDDNDPAKEGARRHTLAALLPAWQLRDLNDKSVEGQSRLCNLLVAALRRERQRGLARDWTYSVARHAAIARTLPIEVRRLATLKYGSGRLLPTHGNKRMTGGSGVPAGSQTHLLRQG